MLVFSAGFILHEVLNHISVFHSCISSAMVIYIKLRCVTDMCIDLPILQYPAACLPQSSHVISFIYSVHVLVHAFSLE